jgi:hypothetical protein
MTSAFDDLLPVRRERQQAPEGKMRVVVSKTTHQEVKCVCGHPPDAHDMAEVGEKRRCLWCACNRYRERKP